MKKIMEAALVGLFGVVLMLPVSASALTLTTGTPIITIDGNGDYDKRELTRNSTIGNDGIAAVPKSSTLLLLGSGLVGLGLFGRRKRLSIVPGLRVILLLKRPSLSTSVEGGFLVGMIWMLRNYMESGS